MSNEEKSTTSRGGLSSLRNLDIENATSKTDSKENIPQFHREYLLKRHGTLELDPLPAPEDADPYNWPAWKVFLSYQYIPTASYVVLFCMLILFELFYFSL